jgi:hypothetical protein
VTNTETYRTASQTQTATPTAGSSTIPQFAQTVMLVTFDATLASGYTKITSSPGAIDFAENEDELLAIARRRVRRACADTIDIPHPCIPFLRCGDHVQVTNHARSLSKKDGYVTKIKRTADVTNGSMRQVTTVAIPPTWV